MGEIVLHGRWPYHSPPSAKTGQKVRCWVRFKNKDWLPPWQCLDVKVHHYLYRSPGYEDLWLDDDADMCLHPQFTGKIYIMFDMPQSDLWWYAEWFTKENGEWTKQGSNEPVLIDNPAYEPGRPWWKKEYFGVPLYAYMGTATAGTVVGVASR